MRKCTITGCSRNGVIVGSTASVTIDQCKVEGAVHYGVLASGAEVTLLDSSVLCAPGAQGGVEGLSALLTIRRTRVHGGQFGFHLVHAMRLTAEQCQSRAPKWRGS